MLKIKKKTLVLSTSLFLIGAASVLGAAKAIIDTNIGAFADSTSDLPACSVNAYTGYATYTTITSPINLTEDMSGVSYKVTDQTTTCSLVVNLNGHTVSSYTGDSIFEIGSNVSATIEGPGTLIATPYSVPLLGGMTSPVVDVSENSKVVIKNLTAVDSGSGGLLTNAGTTNLINVTTDSDSNVWNLGTNGHTIINGGTYGSVRSREGGMVTINSGTVRSILVQEGTWVVISGGTFDGGYVTNSSAVGVATPEYPTSIESFAIEGGTFTSTRFLSPVIIDDGNFTSTTFVAGTSIAGGTFTDVTLTSDMEILAGTYTDSTVTEGATVENGNFTNTAIEDSVTITGGVFTDTVIANNATIENGTFKNTTLGSNAIIENGTFDGITIPADATISGGTFTNVTIEDGATITGGTYSVQPSEEDVADGKKVVLNDNYTYSVVDEDNEQEAVLPACTNVRVYTSADDYTIMPSPISLSADIVASYVVPDQDPACSVIIRLNGHTLTSVEDQPAITIGSGATTIIDGDDGKIVQNSNSSTSDTASITNSGSTTLEDVTVSGDIYNQDSGSLTLDDVTTEDSTIYNQDNGTITIESGDYTNIISEDNSSTTISGGSANSVTTTDNAETTIEDGKISAVVTEGESETTITGGEISAVITDENGKTTIEDGTIGTVTTGTSATTTIKGGTYTTEPEENNVSNDKTITENTDGTYTTTPTYGKGGGYYYYYASETESTLRDGDEEKQEEQVATTTTTNRSKIKSTSSVSTTPNVPDTGETEEDDKGATAFVTIIVIVNSIALAVCGYLIWQYIRGSKEATSLEGDHHNF